MMKIQFISFFILFALNNASKEYGYFEYTVTNVQTCQGPKRKDCCVNSLRITTGNVVGFEMDCREKVIPTKSKIVASIKNQQKVRLQMNKPCSHMFIKPIILSVFNATDECVIAKNIYRFNLDFTEISQKYYSGMFLYGNWTFQSFFFNDYCNFLCFHMEVNVHPKKDE